MISKSLLPPRSPPPSSRPRSSLALRWPHPPPTPFTLVVIASGQPFHNQQLSASSSGLEIGKPNADAHCSDGTKQDHAAFILRDGWFLYNNATDASTQQQQLWSDADRLNHNRITTDEFGFIGAGTSSPTWNIDSETIACPSSSKNEGRAWCVWLNAGVQNPGDNKLA
ncbi:hypothetical protein DBV05_g6183 [Lasiodiplodia theobromae]|uniref:Uncharacterized protein n=1 Tax=Lasiodiplodia theobromae TaxID=45133 RepID=A0A5N5DBL4_9PEZI|nr:hypothetical protein DBV05_g6183 [Lasiodiplodia theobromae]